MHVKHGGNNFKEAELPYRAGLKISLIIRENINNEIVWKLPLRMSREKTAVEILVLC